MVIDDDVFCVWLGAFRRVGSPCIHQNYASHPAARQFVRLEKTEVISIEREKVAHVLVHLPRQHRDRFGK